MVVKLCPQSLEMGKGVAIDSTFLGAGNKL